MADAQRSLAWRPALDGLRGLAVIAVMLYHYKTRGHLPGGLFGVDVFFVLSGFLITTLLVQEWNRERAISLSAFYSRRCLRLAAAALVFLIVYCIAVAALSGSAAVGGLTLAQALENTGYALAQVYNWAVVRGSVDPGGFNPIWSLAVEAQFYALWPALLVLLLRGGVRLPFQLIVCGSLIYASIAVPFLLKDPEWPRVYFGADYRAHALLIGSFAGLLFAAGRIDARLVSSHGFRLLLAGAVLIPSGALALSTEHVLYTDYRWLFPAVAFSAAIVVVAAAFSDELRFMRLLHDRRLTWVGRRSYAIYLCHYPVGMALASLPMDLQLLAAACVTFALAEVSFRLVEAPVLRSRSQIAANVSRWRRSGQSRRDPVSEVFALQVSEDQV